jgi:dolichol-phosphate mannosyltransferase
MKKMLISIVISVYNEEKVIGKFYDELQSVISGLLTLYQFEIIFVNDGSKDKSGSFLDILSENNEIAKVIHLSNNFGHEAAMIAGIDHSRGDATICMDADLQHPPLQIPKMLEKFEEGFDVINMVRLGRDEERFFRNLLSRMFYIVLRKISSPDLISNASDFFLISKKVSEILRNSFRERARFIRGFTQIVGFRKTAIEFSAHERLAGESKYSLFKLMKLSVQAISAFSTVPLKLGVFFGFIISTGSLAVGIYSIIMKIIGEPLPGYTTIVVLLSFLSGVQLLVIGIIGEYIGILLEEAKGRPIYIVDRTTNL